MPPGGARTRGASALEDWADSLITLTRDDSEIGGGELYRRAVGRDVEVEEDRLDYDPCKSWLTLAGAGSRKLATVTRRHDDFDQIVLAAITLRPGMNGTELGRRLKEDGAAFQNGDERKAAQRLVASGKVRFESGSRNAKTYYEANYPDLPRLTPAGQL